MHELRCNFRERREHKPSQVGMRMRYLEAVVRDHATIIEQQVEIQRAGSMVDISAASMDAFDVLQRVQQVVRRQARGDRHNGVEIVRLGDRTADRRSLV
jgi:hypothetical protein